MMVYKLSEYQIGTLWGFYFWADAPKGQEIQIKGISITENVDLIIEYVQQGRLQVKKISHDEVALKPHPYTPIQ